MKKKPAKVELAGSIQKTEKKMLQVYRMWTDEGKEYVGIADCSIFGGKIYQNKAVYWAKELTEKVKELL